MEQPSAGEVIEKCFVCGKDAVPGSALCARAACDRAMTGQVRAGAAAAERLGLAPRGFALEVKQMTGKGN